MLNNDDKLAVREWAGRYLLSTERVRKAQQAITEAQAVAAQSEELCLDAKTRLLTLVPSGQRLLITFPEGAVEVVGGQHVTIVETIAGAPETRPSEPTAPAQRVEQPLPPPTSRPEVQRAIQRVQAAQAGGRLNDDGMPSLSAIAPRLGPPSNVGLRTYLPNRPRRRSTPKPTDEVVTVEVPPAPEDADIDQ